MDSKPCQNGKHVERQAFQQQHEVAGAQDGTGDQGADAQRRKPNNVQDLQRGDVCQG